MTKPNIYQYASALARVVASRSEDPYCKVGAVAFDKDNRIIATGYNGAAVGKSETLMTRNREKRLRYVYHAEQNMCSLFRRGDVRWVFTTLSPCLSCLKLLDAHLVEFVVYDKPYEREDCSTLIKHINIGVYRLVNGAAVAIHPK